LWIAIKFAVLRAGKIDAEGIEVPATIIGYTRHEAESSSASFKKRKPRGVSGKGCYYLTVYIAYESPFTGLQMVKKHKISFRSSFLPDLLIDQIIFKVSLMDRIIAAITSNPKRLEVPDWGVFEHYPDSRWIPMFAPMRHFVYPWPVTLKVIEGEKFNLMETINATLLDGS
jgi:hypothetical protein